MENLPSYIASIFFLTTLLTAWLFIRATRQRIRAALVISMWLLLQLLISHTSLYSKTNAVPPPFLLAVVPPLLLTLILFALPRGRQWIDTLDIRAMTLLHIIRIPVEIVLLLLYLHRQVPGIMTFEGHNFDLLSGLTAPVVYYFTFIKRQWSAKWLLLWNVICLALLLNIFVTALLSAPFPFQQLAFDQPNRAILYFPFVWLPAFVVPVVLFSQLAAIRQLVKNKTTFFGAR